MAKGAVEWAARRQGSSNPERVARMAMGTDEERVAAKKERAAEVEKERVAARAAARARAKAVRVKAAVRAANMLRRPVAEEDAEDSTPVVAPPRQKTRKYKPFFGRGRRRTRSL